MVVNDLIQTCKDGQQGFHDAADRIRDIELKALFHAYAIQRSQFAEELETASRESEDEDDRDSSIFSGPLHQGWVNLKAAIAGNNQQSILAECERGEDDAVSAYQRALETMDFSPKIRAIVERQFNEIQKTRERVVQAREAVAQ